MTKRKFYAPRPGTVPKRVIDFFRANPEEELTISDIAIKFDVPQESVNKCLNLSVKGGLLVKVHDDNGRVAFRLPDLITEGAAA